MKVSIKHSLRLIIIIPIMFLLSWYVARYTEQDMRNELLNQTVFGANSVDIEQFKLLKGTLADLKSPAYLQLKHQFARMLKSDSDFHFIYIILNGLILVHVNLPFSIIASLVFASAISSPISVNQQFSNTLP